MRILLECSGNACMIGIELLLAVVAVSSTQTNRPAKGGVCDAEQNGNWRNREHDLHLICTTPLLM